MFARMDKISKQKTIYLVENNIYIENSPSFTTTLPHLLPTDKKPHHHPITPIDSYI